jgi:hypothetical protein
MSTEKTDLEGSKATSRSERWWEYYFVRYFFGTVVGSGIVYVWIQMIDDSRFKRVRDSVSGSGAGEFKWSLLIAALGFLFCYAASAPMLTFHTLRAQTFQILRESSESDKFTFEWSHRQWGIFGLIVLVVLLPITWLALAHWELFAFDEGLSSLGLLFIILILIAQFFLIFRAHADGFVALSSFYKKLGEARASTERGTSGFVESYRHIREHSNAYAIVLLELALASFALSVKTVWELGLLLFVWMAPATYCWFLANVLEARLVLESPNGKGGNQ